MTTANVLIFGVGYHGRAIHRKCRESPDKYNVIGFLDNDASKHHTRCFGTTIYSPSNVDQFNVDGVLVAGPHRLEMKNQLTLLGVEETKILVWGRSKLRPHFELIRTRSVTTGEMLNRLCMEFDKNKLLYWLDFSGLLAVQRPELLPELSDVDISVAHNDMDAAVEIICGLFSESDVEVCRLPVDHCYYLSSPGHHVVIMEQCDSALREPATLDVMVKFIEKKNTISRMGSREISSPKMYFDGFSICNYEGYTFRIPVCAEDYLSQVYGPQWQVPVEFFDGH